MSRAIQTGSSISLLRQLPQNVPVFPHNLLGEIDLLLELWSGGESSIPRGVSTTLGKPPRSARSVSNRSRGRTTPTESLTEVEFT